MNLTRWMKGKRKVTVDTFKIRVLERTVQGQAREQIRVKDLVGGRDDV